MRHRPFSIRILALALLLLCSGCGLQLPFPKKDAPAADTASTPGASDNAPDSDAEHVAAVRMQLSKFQGDVAVTDKTQKSVEPREDDETLDIRTATMVVGVRGTCGWVEVPDEAHMNISLLEGSVECTIRDADGSFTFGYYMNGDTDSINGTLRDITQINDHIWNMTIDTVSGNQFSDGGFAPGSTLQLYGPGTLVNDDPMLTGPFKNFIYVQASAYPWMVTDGRLNGYAIYIVGTGSCFSTLG